MKNSISCPRLEKRKDCPETHKNYNFEDLQRPETLLRVLWSEKKSSNYKSIQSPSQSALTFENMGRLVTLKKKVQNMGCKKQDAKKEKR